MNRQPGRTAPPRTGRQLEAAFAASSPATAADAAVVARQHNEQAPMQVDDSEPAVEAEATRLVVEQTAEVEAAKAITEEVANGPCNMFTVDVNASRFAMCKCGFHRMQHGRSRPVAVDFRDDISQAQQARASLAFDFLKPEQVIAKREQLKKSNVARIWLEKLSTEQERKAEQLLSEKKQWWDEFEKVDTKQLKT